MKVVAVTCTLLLLQLVGAQYGEEPDETAPYSVTRMGQDYQERVYQPAKWVCHDNPKNSYSSSSQRKSFFALFRYITGSNEQKEEMPMTSPVTMLAQTQPDGSKRYQMCFYLPEANQAAPPAPTNKGVYIEERPAHTVLTRTFGGYAMRESVWESQAKILKESLQAAGETGVDFSSFYSAGYDSPMKLTDRRNEVWYVKEN
ncbi:heme-binding protein 1-like [Homarus americanus]|uniref:Heme-binding protein 1-like 1 n=1 Tax=Homarus americanus TaxID=6706 RepID=A0A8J5N7E7_HOMAM|nr:heme-binding protein 1-like [Homarus americanus]KAG7174580.1 Heme-binding protein 1-like 1 [Homarus americanus]